jgi:hypothetical protein
MLELHKSDVSCGDARFSAWRQEGHAAIPRVQPHPETSFR